MVTACSLRSELRGQNLRALQLALPWRNRPKLLFRFPRPCGDEPDGMGSGLPLAFFLGPNWLFCLTFVFLAWCVGVFCVDLVTGVGKLGVGIRLDGETQMKTYSAIPQCDFGTRKGHFERAC